MPQHLEQTARPADDGEVLEIGSDRKQAGVSADAHFREGRAAWRKRRRNAFAILCAVLILPPAIAWVAAPEPWSTIAIFIAGLFVGMLVLAWDSPPEFIDNWRRGAEGERKTAKALRRLVKRGWIAVHDLPGEYGNRDHVLVGPPGVFLLDTKNVRGVASVEEGLLTVRRPEDERASYQYSRLARGITGASASLREELASRTQVRGLWVHPVVVVWPVFEGEPETVGGVTYVGGNQVANWLARLEAVLAPEQVAGLSRAIRELRG
jgi:hypothetical protein